MTMANERRPVLRYLPATIWSILIVVPFFYLVLTSFKDSAGLASSPLGLPRSLRFENYAVAWEEGNLATALINSLTITISSVVGVVLFASMASYSITRWRGRLGSRVYLYFALGLIVPFQLGLPTLYKVWAQMGLVNTQVGVILVQIGASLPLAVFLYCGFLRSVPIELEEAARIDGAGDIRTFFNVVFPLLRPVTATVIILTSISVWNDLLISLYFLQTPATQTLPRAIIGFQSSFNNDLPVIFACAVLTVIPIVAVFVSLQRSFMSGISAGALRG